jgi:hypothetical protein
MQLLNPWISENYKKEEAKFGQLLILGESHYDERMSTDPNFTIHVVSDVIDGTICSGYRYNTLLGNIFNPEERSDLFLNCAFANLIQVPLIKPRVNPTEAELATIKDAFWEILRITKPRKVIVTSLRAWNFWLPDADPRGMNVGEIEVNKKHSAIWKYEFEDVYCHAIGISHPSGRAFYPWRDLVLEFVNKNLY